MTSASTPESDLLNERERERERERKGEYRPDIDGLRAFAVLSVLAFHAFPSAFKTGFLGVDIFFVISGYLISSIILKQLNNDTFSFLQFYSRRIRRIFPALVCVLLAVLAFGWFALLPHEYRVLGKHVAGGSFFASNFVLWKESGYFDAAANTKPLLHLWSLGIEEQFYIAFPALMYLCHKKNWRYITILLFMGILSFISNLYLVRINQTAAFYSPLTRVWELLAGAILATARQNTSAEKNFQLPDSHYFRMLYTKFAKSDGHAACLSLAVLGVILLSATSLIAQETTQWPGWRALFPVCGAGCLIAAGSETWINRYLLGNRVAVFIGRISYPLYLWHWALISYAWIILGDLAETDIHLLRLKLIGASFAFAVLTYLFVERPIRFGFLKKSAVAVYLLIFCMCATGGMGLTVYFLKGVPQRDTIAKYPLIVTYLQSIESTIQDNSAAYEYMPDLPHKIKKVDWYCASFRNAEGEETIALYGDSTARVAYSGVADFNKLHGINTIFVGMHLRGAPIPDAYDDNDYNASIYSIIEPIIKNQNIKKVFIFNSSLAIIDRGVPRNHYMNCLQNLINKFHDNGKIVYLVEEEPRIFHSPEYYRDRPFNNRKKLLETYYKKIYDQHKERIETYNKLKNVTVIRTFDFWMNNKNFRLTDSDGNYLYSDYYHLNIYGSKIQAEELLAPYLLSK